MDVSETSLHLLSRPGAATAGRSPRRVFTIRAISPPFSKPAVIMGPYTWCDSSRLVAMKTCPPGDQSRSSAGPTGPAGIQPVYVAGLLRLRELHSQMRLPGRAKA